MDTAAFQQIVTKLGFSTEWRSTGLIDHGEIAQRLRQQRPYLALRRACFFERGSETALLAVIEFGAGVCDGHYPDAPSIPLVDMGRAMDQAAAPALNQHDGIPLLKRISKLRAESMEAARPESPYWVWAAVEKGELVTRLHSASSGTLLASIYGWEYDHAPSVCATEHPQLDELPASMSKPDVSWTDAIPSEQIAALIPQAPPFFILRSARTGITRDGAKVVETVSRLGMNEVAGHLDGKPLLGPMHYSRSLAQTGMLLSALLGRGDGAVAEVVSAKGLWYDTREYFGPEAEIVTTVISERAFARAGHTFVTLRGVVTVHGKAVLGTDGFTYVLVPPSEHPARRGESIG